MATVKNKVMYVSSLCVSVKAESTWSSSNPVLKAGEIAVTLGCSRSSIKTFSNGAMVRNATAEEMIRVKVGDGVSKWSALKYLDSYNGTDIATVANLAASGIYSNTQLITDLTDRVRAMETAVEKLSQALLNITNSIITNVTKE